MLVAGHDVASPTDAVLGALMARNLGIGVGDGFVVLGSKLDGGVAALALRVSGIVETGSTDLDRALVRVHLAALQDEFGLGDRAHMIVLRLETFELATALLPRINAAIAPLATNAVALSWQQLMPEMSQTIQLKRAGSLVMFGLIALLVTFSVFNSFMMSVFERTREIGMLLAIGMRPGSIVGVLQVEAAWLALLGAGIGVALGAALMALVQHVGIPLGGMAGDLAQRYHMPARLFPALDVDTLIAAPLLMLCATQLAALIPALRIRRLEPVDALRVRA
jgi:ABC-type lipoprotein release transport system permease subunit